MNLKLEVAVVGPTQAVDLKALVREKGEDWAVAAIVEGSIGYNDPASAKRVLTAFLQGETQYWSERCMCCFDYDLGKMMRYDLEGFLRQEESLPDKVERIIAFVRQWAKRDEGPLSTIGLLYPSLGL